MKTRILLLSIAFISLIPIKSFSIGGEPEYLEKGLQGRSDIVFFGAFEKKTCDGAWQTAWGTSYIQGCPLKTVRNSESFQNSKSLRFTYKAGKYGSWCKLQFPSNFRDIPGSPKSNYDSLYFRYYVKFESGFDFKRGGKLPGLMSPDGNSISGGAQPNGRNGWSMRYMWSTGGKAVIYCYLPEGFKYAGGDWGNTIELSANGEKKYFTPGKWHCIEQFVKLNTPGRENGKLHVWFDGELSLKLDDVTYRTVNNTKTKIGGIFFSTFHGGNNSTYAPSRTCYAMFDNLVAAEKYIGPNKEDLSDFGVTSIANVQNETRTKNNSFDLSFNGTTSKKLSLHLTDLKGRIIPMKNWKLITNGSKNTVSINTRNIARGVYLVTVKEGLKKLLVQKISIR